MSTNEDYEEDQGSVKTKTSDSDSEKDDEIKDLDNLKSNTNPRKCLEENQVLSSDVKNIKIIKDCEILLRSRKPKKSSKPGGCSASKSNITLNNEVEEGLGEQSEESNKNPLVKASQEGTIDSKLDDHKQKINK